MKFLFIIKKTQKNSKIYLKERKLIVKLLR